MPSLSKSAFPAVYPESLKKRPQGVSCGQFPPTWHAAQRWPVWRANDGSAYASGKTHVAAVMSKRTRYGAYVAGSLLSVRSIGEYKWRGIS